MTSVEIWSDKASYNAYGSREPVASALLFKVDHVGDFILSLDAILAFKSRFPDAFLHLVCAPWNLKLAESLDVFDDITTIEFFDIRADGAKKELTGDLIEVLPKRHFDVAVDLRIDPDTRILLDHVSATYKFGYESHYNKEKLTVALPWALPADAESNLGVHQALLMLRLIHSLGDFLRMSPKVGDLLRDKLRSRSSFDLGFAENRILVVCNTSSGRDAKNWPPQRFRDLIRWLCVRMEVAVLLVGAKDQIEEAERTLAYCSSPLLASAVGQTTLPQAIDLVGNASLYIGNDSGLTHVAARLGLPTIDILSGIDPAAMWVPIGPNVTAIKAPVPCSPCHILSLKQCRFDHACIENISLDLVKAVVRRILLTCKVRTAEFAPAFSKSA